MPMFGRFQYLEALPRKTSSHASALRGAAGGLMGTLVLIHGFPLSPRMWEPQLELADQGWRIIVPYLRGFDGTLASPVATSVDDYAGDIIDLLDGLHVGHAVIGGLSMGGYITLALFRHAPQYFRAMVLADTRAQADPPQALEGREQMLAAVQEHGVAAAAVEMLPRLVSDHTRSHYPEVVETLRAMILRNSADAVAGAITALMTRRDSLPLLPSIHCPTLIVVGKDDAITPPAFSEEMQRAIPGSELAVLPDAGHMANMEQPTAFNDALGRFLQRHV